MSSSEKSGSTPFGSRFLLMQISLTFLANAGLETSFLALTEARKKFARCGILSRLMATSLPRSRTSWQATRSAAHSEDVSAEGCAGSAGSKRDTRSAKWCWKSPEGKSNQGRMAKEQVRTVCSFACLFPYFFSGTQVVLALS
jgi:hypothetical protein